jgi:hypothetical protein
MLKRCLITLILVVGLSSCSVTNHTYRAVQITKESVVAEDVVVDVKVDLSKPIKSTSSKRNSADEATHEAYYKALTENSIDLVVDPIFELTTTDTFLFFGGKYVAKLTGFAGYYANPRSKREAVKELQSTAVKDIVCFDKFYFPDFVVANTTKSVAVAPSAVANCKVLKSGMPVEEPTKEPFSLSKNLSLFLYRAENKFNSDFSTNGYAVASTYDLELGKKIGLKIDGVYAINSDYDNYMQSLYLKYALFPKFTAFAGGSAISFVGKDSSLFNSISYGVSYGVSYAVGKHLVVEYKLYDFSTVSTEFDVSYTSTLFGVGYRF